MPRKKSKANYFTAETEKYIKLYNTSTNADERAKIFTDHIYQPFYKLVENIIHTFKFYYIDTDTIENLKFELVAILLEEKIMKFDPDNGAKAFSYFGTIVKRWLINYNNVNYKKLKKIGDFSEMEESYDDGSFKDPIYKGTKLAAFIDEWVGETYEKIDDMFEKENDLRIADAILTSFRTRNDIEIFKKKALYIYIREMTDCETPHLTKVITVLKRDFYKKYQKSYDIGLIDETPY